MTKLSEHFDRAEFACRCGCNFDTVDAELLMLLERIRRTFDAPVTITSGCRCPDHNAKVGGAPRTATSPGSQHLYGRAADIKVGNAEPADVYRFLCEAYPGRYGFGLYASWVHADSRAGAARWRSVSSNG